jgi:L-threonylcarbamoyladenylate synthase
VSGAPVVRTRARRDVVSALGDGQLVVLPGPGGYLLAIGSGSPDAMARFADVVASHADGTSTSVVVSRSARAAALAAGWSEEVRRVTDRMWPGPLILLLPAHTDVPDHLMSDDTSVRIGVPCRRLVRQASDVVGPLVTASLRSPDGQPLTTVDDVITRLSGTGVVLVADGGTCDGQGPTVLDCTVSPLVVRYEGALPSQFVDAVLFMGARRRRWSRAAPVEPSGG